MNEHDELPSIEKQIAIVENYIMKGRDIQVRIRLNEANIEEEKKKLEYAYRNIILNYYGRV